MKKSVLTILLVFLVGSIIAKDLSDLYIIDYGNDWEPDIICLKKIGINYLFLYNVPTNNGRHSFSSSEVGTWDGEQIIFDNGFSIYALKPLPDGTLHYYAIKDENEFPGKDFRPITEEDLRKIAELK